MLRSSTSYEEQYIPQATAYKIFNVAYITQLFPSIIKPCSNFISLFKICNKHNPFNPTLSNSIKESHQKNPF